MLKVPQQPKERRRSNSRSRQGSVNQFIIKVSQSVGSDLQKTDTRRSPPSMAQTQSSFTSSKPSPPRDGQVLEILCEQERATNCSLLEGAVRSLTLEDGCVSMALDADVQCPAVRRQLQYNVWYHDCYARMLTAESESFARTLQNHKIKDTLRAKMADWMLEVFGNYARTTTPATYFRAVCLMDLFLRKSAKYQQLRTHH